MKNILVTGGAGFIASNFLFILLKNTSINAVVNLDKMTYAGKEENMAGLNDDERYSFVKGDICDKLLVRDLLEKFNFDTIVHFAAESHVDNSIDGPEVFIQTNIMGSFILLDCAKRYWNNNFEDKLFIHVSTDEVYGHLDNSDPAFTEETPYDPSSPYSASKASSDHIVLSYFKTFKMPVIVTNCSNNYGPRQDDEKLIPTVIRTALKGDAIPIYGKGENIRDWLFVDDHCLGILDVISKGRLGEKYNIGGNNEWANIDLVKKICEILDKEAPKSSGNYSDQITFVTDRLGHDKRYAINPTKMNQEIGWEHSYTFNEALLSTIKFYINKYN